MLRIAVWVMTVSVLASGYAPAQETSQSVSASGPTPLLTGWTCWMADCSFANCRVTTLVDPRAGRLVGKVTNGRIPANGGVCAGRQTRVLNVTYVPRRGAGGDDAVVLQIDADNGHRSVKRYAISLP